MSITYKNTFPNSRNYVLTMQDEKRYCIKISIPVTTVRVHVMYLPDNVRTYILQK